VTEDEGLDVVSKALILVPLTSEEPGKDDFENTKNFGITMAHGQV